MEVCLVIDGDPAIVAAARERLALELIEQVAPDAGEDPLAAATRVRPHLILVDLDHDGPALCRRFKEDPSLATIPVIFLTATADAAAKLAALDAGAIDWVGKPLDDVELRARVRVALRTARYQSLLATRAHLDGLTGLRNRAWFDDRVAEEVAFATRTGRPVSLILVDLDHFKRVNDVYGHPFGDNVLREAADCLQRALRRGEPACRYGGEEFAVILRETDLAGAEIVAERMRESIAKLALAKGEEWVPITASFGCASSESQARAEGDPILAATLVADADRALYDAKRDGRNCVRAARAGSARPTEITAAARGLRALAEILRFSGEDVPAFFTAVGIDVMRLVEADARIPFEIWLAAWRRAESVLHGGVGLRVAEMLDFHLFDTADAETEYLVWQIFACSATVGDGLGRLARFLPIGMGASQIRVERDGDDVHIMVRAGGDRPAPRAVTELVVGLIVRALRGLPVEPVSPQMITLTQPPPETTAIHDRVLAAPTSFSAAADQITIGRDALARPIRAARPRLLAQLVAHAEELLGALTPVS
jgi:diguanylate cyclase (GGDEF)-like protein